jgi:hypothetical protein
MWVCSTLGFFSVVKKGTPPNEFQVRARTRRDIENLCDLIELPYSRIVTSHDSDYEYRVLLNAEELGQLFDGLQATITYSNFKSAVSRRPDQQKQCETYHAWWSDAARWQEHRPYSGFQPRLSDHAKPSNSDEYQPPADIVARGKLGNGRQRGPR